MFEARALAIQYGDGEALVEFWKDCLHWYNLRNKVQCLCSVQCAVCSVQCARDIPLPDFRSGQGEKLSS